MLRFCACLSLVALAACAQAPAPSPRADAQRGALLYDNACVQCHGTQAHWRDKHIVQSWPDLLAQVGRWQSVAGQNWSAGDIADVASYLNGRFYRFPE